MRQRKLLLPAFHGTNVSRWEDANRAIATREMESWPVGEEFALRPRAQRITLEVILRTVFGVRSEERFKRAEALVVEFAHRAHLISLFRFARRDLGRFSPWARFKRARAALDAFL